MDGSGEEKRKQQHRNYCIKLHRYEVIQIAFDLIWWRFIQFRLCKHKPMHLLINFQSGFNKITSIAMRVCVSLLLFLMILHSTLVIVAAAVANVTKPSLYECLNPSYPKLNDWHTANNLFVWHHPEHNGKISKHSTLLFSTIFILDSLLSGNFWAIFFHFVKKKQNDGRRERKKILDIWNSA